MDSLQITSPDISKKGVQLLAAQLVEALPESANPLETYAKLQKIKTLAESAMSQLKAQALDSIGDDGATVLGGKMTWQGGGFSYSGEKSYGHYQAWKDAVKKVKDIEAQMKLAYNQPETVIVDENGEQVPEAKKVTKKAFLKYNW